VQIVKRLLFGEAVRRLETGLRAELPGPSAQAKLAPRPRRRWPEGFNPARIRNAAGLLLVYPDSPSGAANIVLTVRSDAVQRHRGQVSLPGGVVEPGETFEQAALREAQEEIALPVDANVRLLGALTPLDIPVSGFRLHPVVAATPARQPLVPSDGEVARILEVRIDDLLDPARLVLTERDRDGLPSSVVPVFQIAGEEIWGATAMVLAEFLALLGWVPAES
jgi:8-oxo-dGTP pyrophosphatase MutT (NUDIX family)